MHMGHGERQINIYERGRFRLFDCSVNKLDPWVAALNKWIVYMQQGGVLLVARAFFFYWNAVCMYALGGIIVVERAEYIWCALLLKSPVAKYMSCENTLIIFALFAIFISYCSAYMPDISIINNSKIYEQNYKWKLRWSHRSDSLRSTALFYNILLFLCFFSIHIYIKIFVITIGEKKGNSTSRGWQNK